jgi:hypothetical protein
MVPSNRWSDPKRKRKKKVEMSRYDEPSMMKNATNNFTTPPRAHLEELSLGKGWLAHHRVPVTAV